MVGPVGSTPNPENQKNEGPLLPNALPVVQSILQNLNVQETSRFLQTSKVNQKVGLAATLLKVQEELKQYVDELDVPKEVKVQLLDALKKSSVYRPHKSLNDIRNGVIDFRQDAAKILANSLSEEKLNELWEKRVNEFPKTDTPRNKRIFESIKSYIPDVNWENATHIDGHFTAETCVIFGAFNYNEEGEPLPTADALKTTLESQITLSNENLDKREMFNVVRIALIIKILNRTSDKSQEQSLIKELLSSGNISTAIELFKKSSLADPHQIRLDEIKCAILFIATIAIYKEKLYQIPSVEKFAQFEQKPINERMFEYIFYIFDQLSIEDKKFYIIYTLIFVLETEGLFDLGIKKLQDNLDLAKDTYFPLTKCRDYWVQIRDVRKAIILDELLAAKSAETGPQEFKYGGLPENELADLMSAAKLQDFECAMKRVDAFQDPQIKDKALINLCLAANSEEFNKTREALVAQLIAKMGSEDSKNKALTLMKSPK